MSCSKMPLLQRVVFLTVLQHYLSKAAMVTVDTCSGYPEVDLCLPGGVWDPALSSCSGYRGMQCYQCYSGEFCNEVMSTLYCQMSPTRGDPLYLVEFWLGIKLDLCTSTKAHYRSAYQVGVSPDTNIAYSALLNAIRNLHAVTKNAVTDGYSVVSGVGATMVTYSAVVALAEKLLENCSRPDCPDHIDVFTQPPHYYGYERSLKYAKNAQWNPKADPNSPWTVEIVTHPNNPDGMKRRPLVTDPERVIMDLVYYWPMYTDIDQTLDKPIMVFSSSKHDGLAGTRFGWGLVKDEDLAQRMISIVNAVSLAMSADIELRIINSMQTILSMHAEEDGLLPFHRYGRSVLSSRFQQVSTIIDAIPGMKLVNSLNSTGGYAWIHCEGPPTCQEEFSKVNVTGISGTSFGASDQEIRFTLMMPSVEFDQLDKRLRLLLYIKRKIKA